MIKTIIMTMTVAAKVQKVSPLQTRLGYNGRMDGRPQSMTKSTYLNLPIYWRKAGNRRRKSMGLAWERIPIHQVKG